MKKDHQSYHTGPKGYGGGHKDSEEIALTMFRSKDQEMIEGLNK
jgi:hypothetical protein